MHKGTGPKCRVEKGQFFTKKIRAYDDKLELFHPGLGMVHFACCTQSGRPLQANRSYWGARKVFLYDIVIIHAQDFRHSRDVHPEL